jgi:hypothetical protein
LATSAISPSRTPSSRDTRDVRSKAVSMTRRTANRRFARRELQ